MSKYGELRRRLSAVEILMLVKKEYTYRELSSLINLPAPVISRYVKGHVLPSLERADELIKLWGSKHLIDLVKRKIRLEENKIFDHSEVLSDVGLLEMVGKLVPTEFSDVRVDRVLTVEVDGVLPASQVARQFNVDVVVAKSRKEMGVRDFVEVRRVYASGAYSYLFVPKHSIRRGDNVLIVDDAIRTGATLETLFKLCAECGANTIGVFALIGLKDALTRLRERVGFPIKVLVEL